MQEEVKEDAQERMAKSLVALEQVFARIRTGRAHPSLLDGISVDYYGTAVSYTHLTLPTSDLV